MIEGLEEIIVSPEGDAFEKSTKKRIKVEQRDMPRIISLAIGNGSDWNEEVRKKKPEDADAYSRGNDIPPSGSVMIAHFPVQFYKIVQRNIGY